MGNVNARKTKAQKGNERTTPNEAMRSQQQHFSSGAEGAEQAADSSSEPANGLRENAREDRVGRE